MTETPRRTRASGLLTNAGWLMASRMVMALLGWIGTVLIVRGLSMEDYGRFTLIFSVLGLLSIVTDLGIGRIAISGIIDGDHDRARFTGSYILLRTALGFVGYALAITFVAIAGYGQDVVIATAVAAVAVVLATPANAYFTVFQAHRKLNGVAVAQATSRVIQLGLLALIATAGGSLLWFVLPAVLAEFVVLGWLLPAAHRLQRIVYRVDRGLWWSLLKEAAPLSVGAALATVYYRVDILMLSWLDDFDAVALYGMAYKFVEMVHFSSSAVTAALLPLLVAAWPGEPQRFRRELRRGGTVLALLGGMIAIGTILFASRIVALVFGTSYVAGTTAMQILVFSELLSFVSALAVLALIATGRHRRYPLIAGVGLAGNIVLNLVLIPVASVEGAALATLTTEIVITVWLCLEVRRVPGLRPLPRPPVIRVALAALLAGATGAGLLVIMSWPVAAAGTVSLYIGSVMLLRAAGRSGLRDLGREV